MKGFCLIGGQRRVIARIYGIGRGGASSGGGARWAVVHLSKIRAGNDFTGWLVRRLVISGLFPCTLVQRTL